MDYFDCHMHSSFSGDSETPPKEMIEEAKRRGLSGICFTDHLDLDYKPSPHLFDLDLERYETTIRSLIKEYSTPGFIKGDQEWVIQWLRQPVRYRDS